MGFRNSPAYMQRFMDKLLAPAATYCKAFIDDIIIFSDILNNYIRYLEDMFSLFKNRDIALSPAKLFVGYPFIKLLGFYIDAFSLTFTDSRLKGFKNLVFLYMLKLLETYLGAAGFLRIMIPYFA